MKKIIFWLKNRKPGMKTEKVNTSETERSEEIDSLIFEKTRIAFGATHPGIKRQNNEDAFKIIGDEIFMVADGMGGHNAGEVASQSAVKFLSEYFSPEIIKEMQKSPNWTEKVLRDGLEKSHQKIKELSNTHPEYSGMGTTIVIAFVNENKLYTYHVGDSRVYVINNHSIEQITNDHSLVWELYKEGKITKEEARLSSLKNRITQALGYSENLEPEFHAYDLKKDDFILLCTDGLWDMLSDEQIFSVFRENETLEKIGKSLINLANEMGGEDNITVIVIKAEAI